MEVKFRVTQLVLSLLYPQTSPAQACRLVYPEALRVLPQCVARESGAA